MLLWSWSCPAGSPALRERPRGARARWAPCGGPGLVPGPGLVLQVSHLPLEVVVGRPARILVLPLCSYQCPPALFRQLQGAKRVITPVPGSLSPGRPCTEATQTAECRHGLWPLWGQRPCEFHVVPQ